MDPLLISLLAVIVVVGSVLVLRLHAFLALTAGELIVALLTPQERVYDQSLREAAVTVVGLEVDGEVGLEAEAFITTRPDARTTPGRNYVYRKVSGPYLEKVGTVVVSKSPPEAIRYSVAPAAEGSFVTGDLLLPETDEPSVAAAAKRTAGARLANGFGDTCGKIGILIAMASIIGTCLLESGSAERVVASTRRLVGDRRTPLAFVTSGFVVGIPVFFDTVFYLLMPLAKAMRLRTGRNYLLYVMSVVIGATMAHSLVPPTPGPLYVASEMGVNLGTMILGGCVVGLIAVVSGYAYIVWANGRWEIPLRDTPASAADGPHTTDEHSLPPLWLAILPILLPVALLTGRTVLHARLDQLTTVPEWLSNLRPVVDFFGDKNIALMLAAAIALLTLVWQKRRTAQGHDVLKSVQDALSSGGVIILITAAGGAFGHVLRQSGVAVAIQERFPVTEGGFTLLYLAFGITAVVRFAQGSATVAMITSVSIVAPLAAAIALPYHPVYLALAIGCGSKPLPWMNDSGFWVVGRMSGMTEAETLKIHSVALTIMGCVGFAVTLLGAKLLPLM